MLDKIFCRSYLFPNKRSLHGWYYGNVVHAIRELRRMGEKKENLEISFLLIDTIKDSKKKNSLMVQ